MNKKIKITHPTIITKEQEIRRMMEDAGVDFKRCETAFKTRDLFQIWYSSKTLKEKDEIVYLDRLIQVLENDVAQRIMKNMNEGKSISENDRRIIETLRDSLVQISKLKYGEKHVNINADFNDIRKMMVNNQNVNQGDN